jgi:putative peptidoglycan lipid II flippase
VLAHYLGLTDAADAFAAAFRIPNFLQNLFGEGVLSASFIPVYARLRAQNRHSEATAVAGAVAGLLALCITLLVAAGVTAAPWLVDLLAPGFAGAKRDLTVRLIRILFPGTGLLVFSAWCLGILNSHRRFFLSYAAPVAWNAAIITATLLAPTGIARESLVLWTAWGAVAGGVLQFAVQLPAALRALGPWRPRLGRGDPNVATVLRTFGPAFLGRGVVQISAFVDAILASLLPTGAVAALANAQLLYSLPVSLFGMSVSAAELPELAAEAGSAADPAGALRARLERALRTVAWFSIPSAAALFALGQVIAAAVFQSGLFSADDSRYVWAIAAGYGIGLVAAVFGRLYASGWYALHDTRTPLRMAVVRVTVGVALGALGALALPGLLGLPARWGAAFLAGGAAVGAWLEFLLLRASLDRRIGITRLPPGHALRLGIPAAAAAAAGWGVLLLLGGRLGPFASAALVLFTFGLVYLGGTGALGVTPPFRITRRTRSAV